MNKKKLLYIFGTRPEAIKIAPLIKMAQLDKNFETLVCITAQHRQMLDQVLDFFNIVPDYDLDIMKPNQDLYDVTIMGLTKLKMVLNEAKPDLILVQGDTTTAFIGALAGFYNKITVAHIEAGLRSGDKHSPFPEEIYRILAGHLAHYHFAPTNLAKANLAKENIVDNVHVVGNTVIDALLLGLELIKNGDEQKYYNKFNFLDFNKKIILITGHRRESFGEPLQNICTALELLAKEYKDVQFVYPVHLNPNVKEVVNKQLSNKPNIFLIDPLDYPYMIWLMEKSYIIITDSGGIQEEAPSLGKPVLVTRDVTERLEGIEAGNARLVGTVVETIITEVRNLLNNNIHYKTMSEAHNPYGDGRSSEYILDVLRGSGVLENI
jgi:UDP-N-acetylglucosamine 2-epimerase (non-hydrolysing)